MRELLDDLLAVDGYELVRESSNKGYDLVKDSTTKGYELVQASFSAPVKTGAAMAARLEQKALRDLYLATCLGFGLKPDPAVLLTFSTGWSILSPSFDFGCGNCVALISAMSRCRTVDTLLMKRRSSTPAFCGPADCRAVRTILLKNCGITFLHLSSCGLCDGAMHEIARAVERSGTPPLWSRANLRGLAGW
ncbi:hypothetical protein M885DRAFT_207197 [Pelagophyceae sp. CCMP2097]|nr:hypothetical protein M885DRAFT_207197 [Pelagophyceae sp. CCMP2097]